jgi:hypothetical protein
MVVLFWLSCRSLMFWLLGIAVLPKLFCLGCPVLAALFRQSFTGSAVPAVLFWQSCSGFPLLAVLSQLFCPSCPVLAALFRLPRLSCSGCSLLAVTSLLSRSGYPVLAVPFWLSRSGCLFFLFCLLSTERTAKIREQEHNNKDRTTGT